MTSSAVQLLASSSANVCTGGRKNQLKASSETIDTPTAYGSPHNTAAARTTMM